MKISDFKVGEKAYVFVNGRQPYIDEVEVFKIGRKYVTVGGKYRHTHVRWTEQYKQTENQSNNYLIMKERPTVMLFKSMEDINQYKKEMDGENVKD